jgi:ArsR family transcriptional regulator
LDNEQEMQLHEQRVKNALLNMPTSNDIETMCTRFNCVANPSRLKILFALEEGELCVEHIVQAVEGNQSAVSHQLKTLKDNGIVRCRRNGKNVLYAVADEHILIMLRVAKEHLNCHE